MGRSPVTLIQNQSLVQRTAVQQNVGAVDADFSHGEIGSHFVQNLSLVHQAELNVIQVGLLRAPGLHGPLQAVRFLYGHIDFRLHMACHHGGVCPVDHHILEGNHRFHHQIPVHHALGSIYVVLQLQAVILQVGSHLYGIQADLRHILGPNGFPDTGSLHIPTSEILIDPALFSSGLLHIEGILHLHHQLIFPVMHQVGDVEGEPGISASVASGELAVDPQLGDEIAAFKMNDVVVFVQTASIHLHRSPVPDVVVTAFILDAAQFRLVSKGYLDLFIAFEIFIPFFFLAAVAVVKSKIPGSIQVFPVVSHKLRSRIILHIALHRVIPP